MLHVKLDSLNINNQEDAGLPERVTKKLMCVWLIKSRDQDVLKNMTGQHGGKAMVVKGQNHGRHQIGVNFLLKNTVQRSKVHPQAM